VSSKFSAGLTPTSLCLTLSGDSRSPLPRSTCTLQFSFSFSPNHSATARQRAVAPYPVLAPPKTHSLRSSSPYLAALTDGSASCLVYMLLNSVHCTTLEVIQTQIPPCRVRSRRLSSLPSASLLAALVQMETRGQVSDTGQTVPSVAACIDGVSPTLVSFLVERFAALEAKFDARFDAVDESIKSLSVRLDEAQKSLRKIRRPSTQDAIQGQDKPERSQSFATHRSTDSLHSRSRTRGVRLLSPHMCNPLLLKVSPKTRF